MGCSHTRHDTGLSRVFAIGRNHLIDGDARADDCGFRNLRLTKAAV
jgi:hypothetical protein